jgi:hypothetical protein
MREDDGAHWAWPLSEVMQTTDAEELQIASQSEFDFSAARMNTSSAMQ